MTAINDLPRLKPDPLPAINPVPEYRASADLAGVYGRTKADLGVPWMGVVTMAFAQYPAFYRVLWQVIGPMASSPEFADACHALRGTAEDQARRLGAGDLRQGVADIGYAEREIAEIQSLIEVFSSGNMAYLMIASVARMLLEGHDLANRAAPTAPASDRGPVTAPALTLIEPHHADPPTRAIYGEIRQTLGLPFVNTDYRALARWPSYFALAWHDLAPRLSGPVGEDCARAVHEAALALAADLPNPTAITPDMVRAAATKDAPLAEVVAVVRLFQWLLPGLVVNVACLRAQLLGRTA